MPERLIDANALENEICNLCKIHEKCLGSPYKCGPIETLYKQPTIEAEPIRHGRWIAKPPYEDETVKDLEFQIVCSRCYEQNSSITFDENSVPIAKTFYRTRYCPNCGAKMDGKSTLGSEANGCWISCAECANTGCKNRYVKEAQEDE